VQQVTILVLGNTDRPEFRPSRVALDRLGRVAGFPDAASALAAVSDGRVVPDVIVIAQAYPGEFSHETIHRLRQAAPLARVLGLLGTWCEGEARTGRPWPGAIRVYWHQWVGRLERELRRMERDSCGTWGLPLTATEEDRLLLPAREAPRDTIEGPIAVYTPSCEMADWLSAALGAHGCATVWLRPPHLAQLQGARAAIFDGSDCRGEQLQELRRLCGSLGQAPTIALLDFPRIADYRSALSVGAAAVVSKPLCFDELLQELVGLQAAG
jgi:DNA-binding NarL/FixJ family response regulator